MVQSRLNKRIKKVQNNISGRQKLLSKLYRIKLEQEKKKSTKKQKKPKKSKPNSSRKRRYKKSPKKQKRSKVSPRRRRVRKVRKPKVVNNNIVNNVNSNRGNNMNNVNSNRGNNMNNVNSNRGNANKCLLKNVHDEMVEVPIEYPGDLWVHNNLEHQRDKPLEYFNDDHLKDVYGHHRKICYGN